MELSRCLGQYELPLQSKPTPSLAQIPHRHREWNVTHCILPLNQSVTGERQTYRSSIASLGHHIRQLTPLPFAVQYDPPETDMVLREIGKRCGSISILDEPRAPFEREDAAVRAKVWVLRI